MSPLSSTGAGTARVLAERKRIQSSAALTKYSNHQTVTKREAAAVFRLDEYSSPAQRKLLIGRTKVLFSGSTPIDEFINDMATLVEKGDEDG